jgi:Putative transposase
LRRYSHRVAIRNQRLREVTDIHVQFEWKDYARGNQVREMRLDIDEFIRRFLLHVLAKGFVRIRHFGLLASINVSSKLEQCPRQLEADRQPRPKRPTKTWIERLVEWTGQEQMRCPECHGPFDATRVVRSSRLRNRFNPGRMEALRAALCAGCQFVVIPTRRVDSRRHSTTGEALSLPSSALRTAPQMAPQSAAKALQKQHRPQPHRLRRPVRSPVPAHF